MNNYKNNLNHIVHVSPCFVDLDAETGGVANVVRVYSRFL